MTSERWQRVKELLNAALELPAAERGAFLDNECGLDRELRIEVQSLIDSYDDAGDFLDGEPLKPPTTVGGPHAPMAHAGERIGAYEIVREIGRGGMGTVFLATRADDAFRKRVAIKVMRRGLDSEFIQRRFRHERQILASLEHSNIASLLDGGTTDDGLPYFVMEFIDGLPIDEYCDRNRLSNTERLRLIAKVCSALDFAHQRRIIHRDIKPGNILINASGEPKLLDFGIAKILDPELTGDTVDPTVTQFRMMTPEYASPEQIRGEPITPAADIYSMGVLLYELLTGHKPYKTRSKTPHEIAHAICEEDPERPSTAIQRVEQTTRGRGTPTTITPQSVSQARGTEPAELRRSLAGDLDNIVLMAMRKEAARRYGTAGELASDILRHLEGRAVRARGDTILYRGGKLLQRYRVTILATTLMGMAVALAMIVIQRDRNRPARLTEFTQAKTVPFTTYTGDESQPAFSPDGKRIAFVWRGPRNEEPEIYVKEIDGRGSPLRLTSSPAEEMSPVWSPDGKEIAFLRTGRDQTGYYVVPSGGGPERKLSNASAVSFERLGRQIDWAPDGKSFIAVDKPAADQPFAVFEFSTDGARRQITDPPRGTVGDVSVVLSPDGNQLGFIRVLVSGINEVYTQPRAGGEAHALTSDRRWVTALAWSPDARDLVFVSNRTGNSAIWRVPATGGTPERLAGVGQNVSDPAFSADGRHLAFTQLTVDANIWRYDLVNGGADALIGSTMYESSPQYSPDGRRIVFRSTRSGHNEIWVCNADGSDPVQLTHFAGPLTGTPRWSPDGRLVAFDSRPEGTAHIYLIPPDGGEPKRFTDNSSAENVVASFSRDGRWIYFASNRGGGWQVWKKAVAGGEAQRVTSNGGFAAFESIDGKWLYYAKSRTGPGLWRVPVDGGEETEVLADLKAGYWGQWAPTQRGIVFIDRVSAAAPAVIYLFNPESRHKQMMGEIRKPIVLATSAISVSPDGRYVLYMQQDQSSSDIMLAEAATEPR